MRLRPELTDGQYPRPRWTAAQRKRMQAAASKASQARKTSKRNRFGFTVNPKKGKSS